MDEVLANVSLHLRMALASASVVSDVARGCVFCLPAYISSVGNEDVDKLCHKPGILCSWLATAVVSHHDVVVTPDFVDVCFDARGGGNPDAMAARPAIRRSVLSPKCNAALDALVARPEVWVAGDRERPAHLADPAAVMGDVDKGAIVIAVVREVLVYAKEYGTKVMLAMVRLLITSLRDAMASVVCPPLFPAAARGVADILRVAGALAEWEPWLAIAAGPRPCAAVVGTLLSRFVSSRGGLSPAQEVRALWSVACLPVVAPQLVTGGSLGKSPSDHCTGVFIAVLEKEAAALRVDMLRHNAVGVSTDMVNTLAAEASTRPCLVPGGEVSRQAAGAASAQAALLPTLPLPEHAQCVVATKGLIRTFSADIALRALIAIGEQFAELTAVTQSRGRLPQSQGQGQVQGQYQDQEPEGNVDPVVGADTRFIGVGPFQLHLACALWNTRSVSALEALCSPYLDIPVFMLNRRNVHAALKARSMLGVHATQFNSAAQVVCVAFFAATSVVCDGFPCLSGRVSPVEGLAMVGALMGAACGVPERHARGEAVVPWEPTASAAWQWVIGHLAALSELAPSHSAVFAAARALWRVATSCVAMWDACRGPPCRIAVMELVRVLWPVFDVAGVLFLTLQMKWEVLAKHMQQRKDSTAERVAVVDLVATGTLSHLHEECAGFVTTSVPKVVFLPLDGGGGGSGGGSSTCAALQSEGSVLSSVVRALKLAWVAPRNVVPRLQQRGEGLPVTLDFTDAVLGALELDALFVQCSIMGTADVVRDTPCCLVGVVARLWDARPDDEGAPSSFHGCSSVVAAWMGAAVGMSPTWIAGAMTRRSVASGSRAATVIGTFLGAVVGVGGWASLWSGDATSAHVAVCAGDSPECAFFRAGRVLTVVVHTVLAALAPGECPEAFLRLVGTPGSVVPWATLSRAASADVSAWVNMSAAAAAAEARFIRHTSDAVPPPALLASSDEPQSDDASPLLRVLQTLEVVRCGRWRVPAAMVKRVACVERAGDPPRTALIPWDVNAPAIGAATWPVQPRGRYGVAASVEWACCGVASSSFLPLACPAFIDARNSTPLTCTGLPPPFSAASPQLLDALAGSLHVFGPAVFSKGV